MLVTSQYRELGKRKSMTKGNKVTALAKSTKGLQDAFALPSISDWHRLKAHTIIWVSNFLDGSHNT